MQHSDNVLNCEFVLYLLLQQIFNVTLFKVFIKLLLIKFSLKLEAFSSPRVYNAGQLVT